MLRATALCLALLSVVACNKRRDVDETGSRGTADTLVTKREMRDTTVIHYDTTVSTDTTHKRGTKPVKTDTVKK